MKRIIVFLILLFSTTGQSQTYKKLLVNSFEPLKKEGYIYIEPLTEDRLGVVKNLTENLMDQGFNITKDKTLADYFLVFSYLKRADNYCPGWKVIRKMEGSIFDIKKNNKVVIEFSFKQSSFEQKCTHNVIFALVKKIAENQI
ncbi:hypothetical protein [Flavobacterium sp. TBRC 19031]|uniref:hypothetical protein n=1 Tax=Flavobacterium mekongense TaxID=3379707 RepID=UPI00399B0B14